MEEEASDSPAGRRARECGRRERRGDGDGAMSGELLNEFERERDARVKRNAERMRELLGNVQLDGCAGPSGGPNTRSSTKRKRSESESERAKRTKKTRSISEAIEFFGMKERSSEQVHALREKFIGFFERAYALHCRAGTTKKKMMSKKQAHRWVKLFGLSGIVRVHKRLKRSPIELARIEAHWTKTGKDAFGPRSYCVEEGCDALAMFWDASNGRYYPYNSDGYCRSCDKELRTGVPSVATRKKTIEAKAQNILKSGIVDVLFPPEDTKAKTIEDRRRFISHVNATGENPRDEDFVCKTEECDALAMFWDTSRGRYYSYNSDGYCCSCKSRA